MSDGIVVTLIFAFKPGTAEQFTAIMPEMFKDTRARKGFRAIRAVRNQQNPDRIIFIEDWDSLQDYQDYIAWRNSRGEGLAGMESVLLEPPTLEFWEKTVA